MNNSNQSPSQPVFQLDEFYLDLTPEGQICYLSKNEIRNNPFPGLRPFKTSEFQLFYGRDGQAEHLINRLKKNHFLAVIGSSGTGKSSLVRAGLLPQLFAGYLYEAGTKWDTAICRPGKNPIENLAFALARIKSQSSANDKILDEFTIIEPLLSNTIYGVLGVVDLLNEANALKNEKRNLLIIVDQFEELFRFNRDDLGRPGIEVQFVNLLLKAAENQAGSIYVVITMRSEFLGDTVKIRGLPEAINEGQYLVPQLSRNQIKEVIENPIKLAEKKIEPGLVELLVNEIEESKAKQDLDQLPVLQHALMRTFQEAAKNIDLKQIDYEHYKACSGMEKALANHAEGKYIALGDGKVQETFRQKIAKLVFQALTDASTDQKGGRRPTQLQTLYEIAASIKATEKDVDEVINHFRDNDTSFIMPPANTDLYPGLMMDISHESLVRRWSRLRTWVAEEAERGKMLIRLSESQQLHEQGVKDLLTEKELVPLVKWYKSSKPQSAWARRYAKDYKKSFDYLLKSENAWKRKTNLKLVSAAAVFIFIIGASILFVSWKGRQRNELDKQHYISSSRVARLQNDLLSASLFMAEAIALSGSKDDLLKHSDSYLPTYYLNSLLQNSSDVEDAAFSKKGDSIYLQNKNVFYRWDLRTGQFIDSVPGVLDLNRDMRDEEYNTALIQLIQHWGVDSIDEAGFGWGKILNDGFEVVLKIPGNIESFSNGIASSIGQLCITIGQSRDSTNKAYIWDIVGGKQVGPALLHSSLIYGGTFNDDASKVLTWDQNNLVRVFKKVNLENVTAGDADIPPTLFKTQMEVITGARLNEQKNGIEIIPVNEWKEKQISWLSDAEEHFKKCKYKNLNYWHQCYK